MGTKPSAAANVAFVVFALVTAASFTRMTAAHPDQLEIGLTIMVWVGFAVMALDRFWLAPRRSRPQRPPAEV
jgi:hypothetical protein